MNPDEIKAYREKLLAEILSESTPPEATPPSTPPEAVLPSTSPENVPPKTGEEEEPKDESEQELPEVCYYVENGSVWHASQSCSYLKNSKNIIESDPEGAEAAGKARPCSKCASNWQ